MKPLLLSALLVLVLSASAEARDRTAILVVGADARLAGTVHARIEAALGEVRGVDVLGRNELALRIVAGDTKPATSDSMDLVLVQAREAYFDDRLVEAAKHVDSIERIVNAGFGRRSADRVTVLAWRTALALAADDRSRAEEVAKKLLAISPEFSPDLGVFRPSVAKLFDSLREQLPQSVEVRVDETPANATILVDDHVVSTRFRTSSGVHKLFVRAPGFAPVSIPFEARSGLVLRAPQPLLLADANRSSERVEAAIWADGEEMPALASSFGADSLVAVGIRGELIRAAYFDGKVVTRSPADEKDLPQVLAWVRSQLDAKGRSRHTRPHLDIATVFVHRRTTVGFAAEPGFAASIAGGGLRGSLTAQRGSVRGDAEVAFVSFASSSLSFETPDRTYHVDGGQLFRGGARISYELDYFQFSVRPVGGLILEQDDSGGRRRLAVYPAYARADGVLGVGVDSPSETVLFGAEFAALQNLAWNGKNGWRDPSVPTAFAWRLYAGWALDRRFELRGGYAGALRSTHFDGEYPVPTSPSLRNPRVQDQTHELSMSIRYAFR